MKKIGFLFIFCLYSLIVCAQTCEKLTEEFEYLLEKKYKKLERITEKKECIKRMELVIRYAKESNCEFPQQWEKDVKRLKETIKQQEEVLGSKSKFDSVAYTFGATDGKVRIEGVFSGKFKLISFPEWMEFVENDGGKVLVFSVQENFAVYPRTDSIVMEDGPKRHLCIVTQEAAALQASVTEHISFGQDGGTSYIFVETNDTSWSIIEELEWIEAEITDDGAKVICTVNPEKRKRSAKITIQFACGETRVVNVEQAIGRTTLSVPLKAYTFTSYGGDEEFIVKCNYDRWSATPNVGWLHVNKIEGGIRIQCENNTIAKSRTSYVKIETNDDEDLVEYIQITQEEAEAYLTSQQSTYYRDGYEDKFKIPVNTNIPFSDWHAKMVQGGEWTKISKAEDAITVRLERNDCNYSRTAVIRLSGKNKTYDVKIAQPNRGYKGRYNDYFYANDGYWRLTYMSFDFHGMTTIGDNISLFNFRWKPVEFSIINLNLDYMMEGEFSASWEPVVRGFLPISRNGKCAAFVGVGAHMSITHFYEGAHSFLIETGMEFQWGEKSSSRLFFKYNGACSLGMSFDIGRWF